MTKLSVGRVKDKVERRESVGQSRLMPDASVIERYPQEFIRK